MKFTSLDSFFFPKSLAVIGASSRKGSLGRAMLENIIEGGYEGEIFPVNPLHTTILELRCYANVEILPTPPDLGIICTPASSVLSVIQELGKKGTKAAVVITAGFAEGERENGVHLQNQMLDVAKAYGVRIIGPNCLGLICTSSNLNATFSTLSPKKGNVAFVSQSGALLVAMLEGAHALGVGFSKLLSVGDSSDLNFADYLHYFKDDPETNAIILYIEALTDAKRFLKVAKETVLKKPVIIMKSGRFQGAAQAVRSHSGALAGSEAVYEAAFRQAGLCRVFELQDIYDLFLALSHRPNLKGNSLAIITNGGGIGILATDTLISLGGELSPLSSTTLNKLNTILPSTWSQGNPVDIIGDASPKRYEATLKILMDDPDLHTILVMHCPTALSPAAGVFNVVMETLQNWKRSRPDLFMVSLQQNIGKKIRAAFIANKVPLYPTPERAIRAFKHLLDSETEKRFIDESTEKPLKAVPKVTKLLKGLIKNNDQIWLDHYLIQEIFTAYDIPVVRTEFAATPSDAKKISQQMGFPLVLKIASKDIVHKSDAGGVILDLLTPEEVEQKAQHMLATILAYYPLAHIEGFILQPMIPLDQGFELFLGGIQDKTFGPVVIFGAGGKAVEVIKDKALALAPLTHKSAMNLIEQTRIFQQLKGYRDQGPIPLDLLIECLIRLSYLLTNHPEVAELDINPLLANTKKILALDTRIRLSLPGQYL